MTISWDSFKAPKELGGLDLGNLSPKNLGLLTKWW